MDEREWGERWLRTHPISRSGSPLHPRQPTPPTSGVWGDRALLQETMGRQHSGTTAPYHPMSISHQHWDSSGYHAPPQTEPLQGAEMNSWTPLMKRHRASAEERQQEEYEEVRGRDSRSPPARRRRVVLESGNSWGMGSSSLSVETVIAPQMSRNLSPEGYGLLQDTFLGQGKDVLGGGMDYAPSDPTSWNLPAPDLYSKPGPDVNWYCGSQSTDASATTSYPCLQQEWGGQDQPLPMLHGWDASPLGEGSHRRPVHEQILETPWSHPGVGEGASIEPFSPLTVVETVRSLHRVSDQGNPVQNYGTVNHVVNVGNMLTGTNYGTVYMESITVTPPDDFMRDLCDRLKVCIRADHMYYASGDEAALRRGQCTPGTRINILQAVVRWAIDMSLGSELVYWLSGQAGAGKTTIAYTIACLFQTMVTLGSSRVTLGGSFFCSRQFSDTRSTSSIVRTIVYHLALRSMAFRTALKEHGRFEAVNHGPKSQLMGLLVEPWKMSAPGRLANDEPCYVVPIDALDELEGTGGTEFLGTLLDVVETQDLSGLKFFVTSRSHPALVRRIESYSNKQVCRLEEVPLEESSADIKLYLEENLAECAAAHQIQQLVSSAAGLFIYAATVVEFVKDRDIEEQKSTLDGILSGSSSSTHRHSRHVTAPLDHLYLQILETCLVDPRDRDNLDVFQDCLCILHTFFCTIERTSTSVAVDLLNASGGKGDTVLNNGIANGILSRLHAVLYIQDCQVMSFHKSFSDFLFDEARSQRFFCNLEQHHVRLANGCFGIMNGQLRFNIAKIPSSYYLDCDNAALLASIDTNISRPLRYACANWSAHLILASIEAGDNFTKALNEFLQLQVLFWIESMNLLGRRGLCQGMLCDAQRCLSKSKGVAEVVGMLADAAAFAMYHSTSKAALSTPHLYVSSLATFPRCSAIVQAWRRQISGIAGFLIAEDIGGEAFVSTIPVGCQVNHLSVSPDGLSIAVESPHGVAGVWDLSTGEEMKVLGRGNRDWVWAMAYSPDGTHLVSVSPKIQVWNLSTGEVKVLEEHIEAASRVAWSPDGTHIVCNSDWRSLRVWNLLTGHEVSVLNGYSGTIWAVAYSPCGVYVAFGSEDGSVRVWDLSAGGVRVLQGHTGRVYTVAYSPGGTHIVSGSDDSSIRVWNLSTGEARVLKGHTGRIYTVACSPDGAHIVSGSHDQSLRVWDLSTGRETNILLGNTTAIRSVVYLPYGTHVISCSEEDFSVRVWDLSVGGGARVLENHTSQAWMDACSLHSTSIVSGSDSESIDGVRDRSTREEMKIPPKGHTSTVFAVACSPDGTHVVSGSGDTSVRVWNLSTGEEVRVLEGHTSRVFAVAYSPHGTHLISGSEDNSVRVWDLCTGEEARILQGHTGSVKAVAYSPDGTHIASGSQDKSVWVWDTLNGQDVKVLKGHSESVNAVAYSPDGTRIVSGSPDQSVRVWNVSTGEGVRVFQGHTHWVTAVAYCPNGTHIISGSCDNSIRVWDLATTEETRVLVGHQGAITAVAYSPDGTHVFSGSLDRSVRMWNLASGEARVLEGHTDRVRAVAYSPDGTRVVSGSDDKSVRVWDVSPGYTPHYIRQKDSDDEDYTGWLLSPTNPSAHLMHIPNANHLPDDSNVLTIPASAVHHLDFSNAKFGDQWAECYTPTPL